MRRRSQPRLDDLMTLLLGASLGTVFQTYAFHNLLLSPASPAFNSLPTVTLDGSLSSTAQPNCEAAALPSPLWHGASASAATLSQPP